KVADLLLVAGDPIAEPELWRVPARIVTVIQGGRVVAARRGEGSGRWPTHPPRSGVPSPGGSCLARSWGGRDGSFDGRGRAAGVGRTPHVGLAGRARRRLDDGR